MRQTRPWEKCYISSTGHGLQSIVAWSGKMDRFSLSRDSETAALRVSMETRHNRGSSGSVGQGGPVSWTVDLASSIRPSLEAKPDALRRGT